MRKVRISGGRRFRLRGRPSSRIEEVWPEGPVRIPLADRGLRFPEVLVEPGAGVREGDPIAASGPPDRIRVLASVAGTVREVEAEGEAPGVVVETGPREKKLLEIERQDLARLTRERGRRALCDCGLWPRIRSWPDGGIPPLEDEPVSVVVRCVFTEPFLPRGSVLLRQRVDVFVLGLQALQKVAGPYAPIYMVVAEPERAVGPELRAKTGAFAWLRPVVVDRIYPVESPGVLAHYLDPGGGRKGSVWFVHAREVLAMSYALFQGLPPTRKYVVLGGEAFRDPHYVRVPVGMRLGELLARRLRDDVPVRVIRGGLLTGSAVDPETAHIEPADMAIAAIPEPRGRPFLAFLQAGADRDSYSRTFLSSLRPERLRRAPAELGGERRMCVACGYCVSVCPVDLLPQWLWRYVEADLLDDAAGMGLGRCVECGLCSYVCPSKIELSATLAEGKRKYAEEEAEAAAAAAAAPAAEGGGGA